MEKGLLALERAQATGEVQREEEPGSALEYLQDIYKGRREPDLTYLVVLADIAGGQVPRLATLGYTAGAHCCRIGDRTASAINSGCCCSHSFPSRVIRAALIDPRLILPSRLIRRRTSRCAASWARMTAAC
jgi:hypothetical protein